MFLAIILITIVIGILFFVGFISLIIFICNIVKRNVDSQKRSLKILIPSVILFVLLIGINIFLIIRYLSNNSGNIVNTIIGKTSEAVSRGFAATLQNFEQNWDRGRLEQLENLTILLSSIEFEIEDDIKNYTLEIIFENNSPTDVKLYFVDLLGNNYLVACDKEEFAYPLGLKDRREDTIPFGKSKYYLTVNVLKEVEIDHVRYVGNNIMINN